MNKKIFSENCNLSSYTTIKVGGIAEYFAEPRSVEEFLNLIKWANLNKQRCQIIGAGSNLFFGNLRYLIFSLIFIKSTPIILEAAIAAVILDKLCNPGIGIYRLLMKFPFS